MIQKPNAIRARLASSLEKQHELLNSFQELLKDPDANAVAIDHVQRQLSRSMFVETSYNAVIGTHLQTQLLNYNQTPTSYLSAFGSIAQSTTVLNSVGRPHWVSVQSFSGSVHFV